VVFSTGQLVEYFDARVAEIMEESNARVVWMVKICMI